MSSASDSENRDDTTAQDASHDADQSQTNDTEQGGDSGEGKSNGKKPLFQRRGFWIILVIVVAVLLIGGILYYLHARQYESTDDAFIDAHIVRLAPQVAGTLEKVAQVDNQHVKAGTLLAVIQPSGPEAQLAEAKANARQAEAQVDQAQAQVESAIAARNQAASQALAPQAEAAKAAKELARYKHLLALDPQAVAGQQLDQAQAQARSTAAQAAAAQRSVASANAQITVARRQVQAAQQIVAARKAQIQQAQVTMGDLELRAPVAGQVVNRSVNVGSYVAPGTQLMAIIPEHIWITANFKETQLQHMRVGQPVSITVDAFPDVKFVGHVESFQHGAGQAFSLLPPQNATGNYVKVVQRVPVRISFDTKNGPDPSKYPIGPGMSVVPTVKVR
ncbi:HlyD family efflux transporter periplasmic adaptor subunit [Porphyrobacter algicida]|uniref:HlyD family efflux transporter periplasmic adaptor subunit n=1 Tax=Qipengyuania algicida TaxID=1836209 RepID=A0A845ABE1_9SPHN|nr:HlyD family secretion protein [Qipengyuania algicida]MXP27752.1 HlyD family efflux transporter periplasmic adaptor subunit [Qipengyuania algicida]